VLRQADELLTLRLWVGEDLDIRGCQRSRLSVILLDR